jgi:polysaccharide biosynthesis/export protein
MSLRLVLVLALAAGLTACAADQQPALDAPHLAGAAPVSVQEKTSWITTSASDGAGPAFYVEPDDTYLLDTGDRLRVFVYGQPNLSRLYPVDQAGRITVPLIGPVRVRGLTTAAAEAAIRSRLGARYVRDPQVTVDVYQNRPFFILGEVRSAGQYPYVGGMTVETAVAIAGGYSERADEKRARVTRRMHGQTQVGEVPPQYVLQPGDTVYIYERYF